MQHLVTVGIGVGFDADGMRDEVRSARSYASLTDEQWGWCMDFVERGGRALLAYPQYARLVEREGLWRECIGGDFADASIGDWDDWWFDDDAGSVWIGGRCWGRLRNRL